MFIIAISVSDINIFYKLSASEIYTHMIKCYDQLDMDYLILIHSVANGE